MMARRALDNNYREQIETVLRLLEGKKLSRESPVFTNTLKWLTFVVEVNDVALLERLVTQACMSFGLVRTELFAALTGVQQCDIAQPRTQVLEDTEAALRAILPKGGWFEAYDNFTLQTESPLSYHIFSSLCLLGATLGRRVRIRMGFFDIFPNYCVVLIGPTGRVKKTSAANIAKGFISNLAVCPIMADAITPEALATALSRDGGHQLIYAPEFSVLFNKQKYNEALTTRIIRLLDCPDTWEVETVARGKEMITNVAITFLGCSTPSLFADATPKMVTSSGFVNRFLLVVEEDTAREHPVPEKGERRFEIKLEETLRYTRKLEGEVKIGDAAFKIYRDWYHARRMQLRSVVDEITAEILERGSDHLLRTAMLTHIAEHRDATICEACMQTAIKLLAFVEKSAPKVVTTIRMTERDVDVDRIEDVLRKAGGVLDHSSLLRRCRLDATTFKRALTTLTESKRVREDKKGHLRLYILQEVTEDA